MLNYFRDFCRFLWVLIIVLAITLVACQVFDPIKQDQVPTQDVGEEPPTLFPTPTSDSPTPISIPTQIDDTEPKTMLVGPAPYPSPGGKVIPWEQLINQSMVADLKWEIYRGELRGIDKSSRWVFSFVYPSGWYSDTKSSIIQGFVQNMPMTQGPAPSEFVKFEIVRLSEPPMIEEGHTLNPDDLITVEMAGEPGLLCSVTQQPNQARQDMVFFQHEDAWLVATGYIALPFANSTALNQFTAIIFSILSSFTFAEQSAGTILAAPTPMSSAQKKPADSDYPAAGICANSQENLVLINIVPGNMPDPRCIKVTAGQRLQFRNGTGEAIYIQLDQVYLTLVAGETQLFDVPCGDYLEPGVHHAILSDGCLPEIWLIDI
jgi:hypothetical protein